MADQFIESLGCAAALTLDRALYPSRDGGRLE